jgi:hypothetical protein
MFGYYTFLKYAKIWEAEITTVAPEASERETSGSVTE